MKAALLQLSSSDDPHANLSVTKGLVAKASSHGAGFVLTPEVTNCVSTNRAQQNKVLCHQDDDPTLAALRQQAEALQIWLLIGSLALKTNDADERFANRSFLISPTGKIAAWYDKVHMFDVAVSEAENYHESAGYRPGAHAVVAQTPFAQIGLTVCYDVRFPTLFRTLAQAGAEILTVPSAFSPVTGAAHWETLLRARAIETGSYVLAPAQTGRHAVSKGRARETYGHTMVIGPWGDVLADAGTDPGVVFVDLDRDNVVQARARIPSLQDANRFTGPS
ncbi:MAG: carbon-nitrogen hydrolase family protein [Pseudomonadota bacterium]